jgi:hypothetical protein
MATLYSYCDESGKHDEHPVVVFAALVNTMESWQAFGNTWAALLRRYNLAAFHTTEALKSREPYGTMKVGDPGERAKDVLPFVMAIVNGVKFAAYAGVDVGSYRNNIFRPLRKAVGKDPHYFCFGRVLESMLVHWQSINEVQFGLILDDDEGKSKNCYDQYVDWRKRSPEIRAMITSICFQDDKGSCYLQAADLFGHVAWRAAQRQLAMLNDEYIILWNAIEARVVLPQSTTIEGGFYGQEALKEFARKRVKRVREG